MKIEYGKSEHGAEFPMYKGQLLSWHLSMTWEDEQAGFPKLKTVIHAMIERRPKELQKERYNLLKASFDRMFGHNAKKMLEIINDELIIAGELNPECGYCSPFGHEPTCPGYCQCKEDWTDGTRDCQVCGFRRN